MEHPPRPRPPSFWKSPAGLALLVAAVAGGFYLLTEHRSHLLSILAYLALAACPLMHVFMHRGHHPGGHHSRDSPGDRR